MDGLTTHFGALLYRLIFCLPSGVAFVHLFGGCYYYLKKYFDDVCLCKLARGIKKPEITFDSIMRIYPRMNKCPF